MHALMMDFPLTIPAIARRARTLFAHRPVSGRRPDRTITRTSYAVVLDRVQRLGAALTDLGVKGGERVATLAWASQEHLEAYLAIPSIGAVLHTLNLRLHQDDLAYIVNDAQDAVLILDESLLPLFEKFRAQTPSIRQVVVIASACAGAGIGWRPSNGCGRGSSAGSAPPTSLSMAGPWVFPSRGQCSSSCPSSWVSFFCGTGSWPWS